MKITKTTITAATQTVKIPAPFDKFYEILSEEEFEETTGFPARPYEIEEIPGYNIKHLAYLIAKDEYYDQLSADGISEIDLVSEDGDIFPAYYAKDRIYRVDPDDMPSDDEDDAESAIL